MSAIRHDRKRAPRLARSGARRKLVACAFGLFVLAPVGIPGERVVEAKEPVDNGTFEYGCRVQPPQKFLKRRTFVKNGMVVGKSHTRALRYFADHYGNAGDEETTAWNSQSAGAQAKTVHFLGLPMSVHALIAPALGCVEKRIRALCVGRSRYKPTAVGGFRTANTYRGPELSNHLFGIAIDIDPERNPCCGCVDPWPSSPLCKRESHDPYERTALPKCWVRAFERFGFDWLGHDELEDTMHFEFLGDPDRITKSRPPAKGTAHSKNKAR